MAPTPVAIDPRGCGCTECIVGEYIPLDEATPEQIQAALRGELRDNTSGELDDYRAPAPQTDLALDSDEAAARAERAATRTAARAAKG